MRVGDGVSHGRQRPCSQACCGHYAMQFSKCHTTAMSFSVLESIFSIWLQMRIPMSQATIQVFLCTASLRRQLCLPFPNIFGWNWLSPVEMQQGMVGGRVGFLVAGLWGGRARLYLKNDFFDQLFFACCRSVSLHIWRFCFFSGGLAHHNSNVKTSKLFRSHCSQLVTRIDDVRRENNEQNDSYLAAVSCWHGLVTSSVRRRTK